MAWRFSSSTASAAASPLSSASAGATRTAQWRSFKTYTLCDALSFVLMERLGVLGAIAFDRHFREFGRFQLLDALP